MRRRLALSWLAAILAAGGGGCGKATDARRAPPAASGEVHWLFSEPAGVLFTLTEITVAQYRACVDVDRCSPPGDDEWCNWSMAGREHHPVNCIDWSQAKAVCRWLGGRLPTEDEWYAEASNGGTRRYPWGDEEVNCERAIWRKGCGRESTWPVCSRPEGNSVSGLCDMSGNVWEWTATAGDESRRVVRGGSWLYDYPDALRAAERGRNVPTDRNNHLGARCVR